jgi:hypothetical protein
LISDLSKQATARRILFSYSTLANKPCQIK